jgi:hypothetical protein
VDDLITRLRAAIDEEERIANAAIRTLADGGWTWQGLVDGLWKRDVYDLDPLWEYIERNDADGRLRQVAAHREILDIHSGPHSCGFSDYDDADPCGTLLALAKAYGIEVAT